MRFTKYAKFGAYHWRQYAQGTKYQRHADRIVRWVRERPVLDVGAGDGRITSLLGAIGVDNEWDGVRLAQAHGVRMMLGACEALPCATGSFAAVTMIDVLEHLSDPVQALHEARRVARVLYLATPPKKTDGTLHDRFHVQEWTPNELVQLVESVGGYCLTEPVLTVADEKCMYARFA